MAVLPTWLIDVYENLPLPPVQGPVQRASLRVVGDLQSPETMLDQMPVVLSVAVPDESLPMSRTTNLRSTLAALQASGATAAGDIQTLNSQMAAAQGAISSMGFASTAAQAQLTQLSHTVDDARSDIAGLKASRSTDQARLSVIENGQTVQDTLIASVGVRVATLEGGLVTVQAATTALQLGLGTTNDTVQALQGTVATVQTAVTAAQGALTALQAGQATNTQAVATLSSAMTAAQSAISAAQASLVAQAGRLAVLEALPRIRYARTLTTDSSGALTVILPTAGLEVAVTPRTPGVVVSLSASANKVTVTFQRLKTGVLGLTVSNLASATILESTVGPVTFDILAVDPVG